MTDSHEHKRQSLLWLEHLKALIEAEPSEEFSPLLRDSEGVIRSLANHFEKAKNNEQRTPDVSCPL